MGKGRRRRRRRSRKKEKEKEGERNYLASKQPKRLLLLYFIYFKNLDFKT
jgi:hypothetical protein